MHGFPTVAAALAELEERAAATMHVMPHGGG